MAGQHSFTKFGGSVPDLDRAAVERLADAETLHQGMRFAGAILMGLYALEIRLKVVICRKLELPGLPRAFETHDLEGLLVVSGLSTKLRAVKRPRQVARNWDELVACSKEAEALRYKPDAKWDQRASSKVLHQLRDPPAGVLPWLSKQA